MFWVDNMTGLTPTLWNYISSGRPDLFLITLFNQYFPYGMFWWMMGFVLFIITHLKTKNLAYSGALTTLYFVALPYTGFITNVYSRTAMQYFGAILGLVIGYYLYRAFKGGR